MRHVSALSFLTVFISLPLAAQLDRGTITGTVTDPSGAAVPSARVVVLNKANGGKFETTSTQGGQYTQSGLPVGDYEVRFDAPGFKKLALSGITLQAGDVVRIDGKLARVVPVSLGKAGFTTRSGIKVVAEKYLTRRMTSQGIGVTNPNDQFDVVAPFAVRITTSGEFIHGAPWAMYRIGKWNGSHGCTNLTLWDAHWFYNTSMPGDVVLTVGTGRPMEYWNGEGGPWNIPWSQWLAMSAGPEVTWSAA